MSDSQATVLPPIPSNIAFIAGPPFVGIILNWFLYGILVVQLYVYHLSFPDDRKKIKFLVYGLFLLDTVQSVCATADGFHWFAKGFGNMIMLSEGNLSFFDAPILDGVIAFIVQTFFCWRIWVLQKSWYLPSAVFLVRISYALAFNEGIILIEDVQITVAGFVGAFATGIGAFQIPLTLLHTLKWQLSVWLVSSALADTLIAIIMTTLLLRSRTHNRQRIDDILVRIVRLTVETNAATASVAIAVLVCLLAIPSNPSIAMAPGYALGKLYSNTLLAVLNNRAYMKTQAQRSTVPPSFPSIPSGTENRAWHPPSQKAQLSTNTQLGEHDHDHEHHLGVFIKTEVTHDVQLKDFEAGQHAQ